MLFKKFTSTFILFSIGFAMPARADIVGGDEVPEPDPIRRSTVALYEPSASGPGGALCTASLLGKDIAVTAAHCIDPGARKPVLLFGRDLRAPDTVRRPVTAVRVNPRWATRQGRGMDQGDIALVKFPGGLPDGYQPAQTLNSDTPLAAGKTAVLAGYGISNARDQTGAGILRKTQVTIADPRAGKTEMIFDQTHGRGACHGDSGGPAYVRQGGKLVLAGVTNRGYPNQAPDDCAHKVVYTKVGAYKSWISQEEKAMRASRPADATLRKTRFAPPVHRRAGRSPRPVRERLRRKKRPGAGSRRRSRI